MTTIREELGASFDQHVLEGGRCMYAACFAPQACKDMDREELLAVIGVLSRQEAARRERQDEHDRLMQTIDEAQARVFRPDALWKFFRPRPPQS